MRSSALGTGLLAACMAALMALGAPACGSDAGPRDDAGDGDRADATDVDASEIDGADVDDADIADVTNSDGDGATGEPTLVRIATPAEGETVSGIVRVRLEPVGVEEREVDQVTLEVGGERVFSDDKLPTELLLDTRDFASGPLTLTASASDGFDQGRDARALVVKSPSVRFVEVTPRQRVVARGSVILLKVRLDAPPSVRVGADFSALDSGYAPGGETALPLGNGAWAISYIVSADDTRADGDYAVPITAGLDPDFVTYAHLSLTLRNQPTIPLSVPGAIYVDAPLPPPRAGPLANAPRVDIANPNITTGGSASLAVDIAQVGVDAADAPAAPKDVVGLIIGVEGEHGYWQIPIDSSAVPAILSLSPKVLLRTYEPDETIPDRVTLRLAVRDRRGDVSPYAAQPLDVYGVGHGDVQVALSWDTDVDLDLHLRVPGGCEIYYASPNCTDSGRLDLDSNPSCQLDHVRNENIFWHDFAPVGEYAVYVDFYQDCANVGANYSLTVTSCDRVEVFDGSFEPGSADGGGHLSGRFVTRFDPVACGRRVHGTVRYLDRDVDQTGPGAATWRVVAGAHVELRDITTNDVFATGTTDEHGDYRIGYAAADRLGYVVAVSARTDPGEGLRDIEVRDHPKFDRLYEVVSDPILPDPADADVDVVQDIDIDEAAGAGAFNIFDVLVRAWDRVRLQDGRALGPLRAYWATGADTTETAYCSRYLYESGVCTEVDTMSVQGKDQDRDELDDMVIVREFAKFVLAALSRDSHPGGGGSGRREDVRRAWSEGLATWLAADVAGSRWFVNMRPRGVTIVDDLEAPATPFARGRDAEGELSRLLVGALLWDLGDAANEAWDHLPAARDGIYDTLFAYFASPDFADAGAEGVDVVDFLRGFECRGWASHDALRALAGDYYDAADDYDAPDTCEAP